MPDQTHRTESPMDLTARVLAHFEDAIELKRRIAATLAPQVARAGERIAACLGSGGKALACGNGGSAADAQHFAAELVGRFERERPGLAAIALSTDTSALTAIANDYSYDAVFAKQVEALGREGDFLLALSTSGNSKSVIEAMKAAKSRGMAVVALTGRDGGRMAAMVAAGDHHLNVAHARTARIQEVHILALHCLCDTIDNVIHGETP